MKLLIEKLAINPGTGIYVRRSVDLTTTRTRNGVVIPRLRERSTDQEKEGGACSKIAALRNGEATQLGFGATIAVSPSGKVARVISGGRYP